MAVFISAGHNPQGIKTDPGAVANGFREADLNIDFRNLVLAECKKLGLKTINDNDNETLGQYLSRIQTGSGSVVLEFHFDAAGPTATGTTALIEKEADRFDQAFAREIVNITSEVLGIRNRGVKSEADSHRGSLALMREDGIICLLELGFITNVDDLNAYHRGKYKLAFEMAKIIKRYEELL